MIVKQKINFLFKLEQVNLHPLLRSIFLGTDYFLAQFYFIWAPHLSPGSHQDPRRWDYIIVIENREPMNKLHIIGGYCDVAGSGQAGVSEGKCLWWMMRKSSHDHVNISSVHWTTLMPGDKFISPLSFVSNSDSLLKIQKLSNFFHTSEQRIWTSRF